MVFILGTQYLYLGVLRLLRVEYAVSVLVTSDVETTQNFKNLQRNVSTIQIICMTANPRQFENGKEMDLMKQFRISNCAGSIVYKCEESYNFRTESERKPEMRKWISPFCP